ncbi:uncharacterized protein LOC142322478 isoform X2 [Lycorma delicatula]|uniref:uncharacterized protein LOC142322478 isoform X2 n=1 Tax=Lycorma delicatula TaxID=130591 RepID=UPI003F50F453
MCSPFISKYQQFIHNNLQTIIKNRRNKNGKHTCNLGNGNVMDKLETNEDYGGDCHNNNSCSNEQTIKNILNMDLLHKSANSLKKLNTLMVQESPGMDVEEGWLHFIQDLGVDMQRLKEQTEELERVLAARDKRHELEVQKLFEEFETQLTEEKEKLATQMELKEKILRHELKETSESKDNQISEALNLRDEVLERLYALEDEKNHVKVQNINLMKIKDEQQKELEYQQNLTRCLQEQLDKKKKQMDEECRKHFEKGFFLAQKIVILEEEGLLQQMKIIKDMQSTLQNSNMRKWSQSSDQFSISNNKEI